MPIHTGASIYAGLFSKDDRAEHKMAGTGAWIQVVDGRVVVAGVTLEKGDGVGITDADELRFDFEDMTELLLFDLDMKAPLIWR
jgi:redox-sensitive bicupin YhaK (pirin superfamily)